MTKYYDIGSVLIGDEHWTFAVDNGAGDVETEIRIYNTREEFRNSTWYGKLCFNSSVQGKFGIFDYDCDYEDPLRGDRSLNDALHICNGRYGVYSGDAKVAFVRWESYS